MKKIMFFFLLGLLYSNDIDMNASVTASYGDSYDFYSFSENRLDLNLFYKDVQAWIQYEYSNPADLGFAMNDIRKFRIEYTLDDYIIKLGDIYEFWGRGLVLNQFDDQTTNYDNGTRGLYFEYNRGPLSFNHINGNSDIWHFGADLRIPAYNNDHSMYANQVKYDWNSLSIGVNQLTSNENYQPAFGNARLDVHHKLNGIYGTWGLSNADIFVEYVDKISTEKTYLTANDTIKRGHGVYGNLNLYFLNWGLSSEYKRYSFDKAHGDFTQDDYGNQIEYQQMPTLGKEQNSTLMGRVSHNYNFNDERGVQFELNGSLAGLTLTGQYSHLSRNENWQSVMTNDWIYKPLDNYLPSSDPSALPYWENYFEVSGYTLNDKVYFKLGRGNNKEIIKTTRYFEGEQRHNVVDSIPTYDSIYFDYTWFFDTNYVYDTTLSNIYNVEAKYWQETKSFTLPMEVNMILDDGYTFGVGFQYQERTKNNINKGNANKFKVNASPYGDSLWVNNVYDSLGNSSFSMPESDISSITTQFSAYSRADSNDIADDNDIEIGDWISNPVYKQYNRLLYISLSKASKWSFTITQEWTNSYESGQNIDPYYNPLEALVFGDFKYFLGQRDNIDPPDFIQNKWVSAELAFYLTSSQRISIMYGSIKGGLFCSNGICREIPAFNDGLKISYTASF